MTIRHHCLLVMSLTGLCGLPALANDTPSHWRSSVVDQGQSITVDQPFPIRNPKSTIRNSVDPVQEEPIRPLYPENSVTAPLPNRTTSCGPLAAALIPTAAVLLAIRLAPFRQRPGPP